MVPGRREGGCAVGLGGGWIGLRLRLRFLRKVRSMIRDWLVGWLVGIVFSSSKSGPVSVDVGVEVNKLTQGYGMTQIKKKTKEEIRMSLLIPRR